jgi:hypothetical protein
MSREYRGLHLRKGFIEEKVLSYFFIIKTKKINRRQFRLSTENYNETKSEFTASLKSLNLLEKKKKAVQIFPGGERFFTL